MNKWQYEGTNTFGCAAAYAFSIAKAHAFEDGNKRTAFVTGVTFLRLNGCKFTTEQSEGVGFMKGLESGEINEEKFVNWLDQGSSEIT